MRDLLYYTQLALESVASVFGLRPYEAPPYHVLESARPVEVRRYAPRVAAEATVRGSEAGDEAFRTLFRYISGDEKIAMTTPVASRAEGDAVRMQFFLPARYAAADAPKPLDPRIRIVALPEETLAVVQFSGRATPEEIERQEERLLEEIASSSWKKAGEPVVFVYDPPFTIPFLKKNEVAVKVTR